MTATLWFWLVATVPGPVAVEASAGVMRYEQSGPSAFDRVQGFAPWAEVGISAQPLRLAVPMPWGSWTLEGRWLRSFEVEGDGARTTLERLRFETRMRLGRFGPLLAFERFVQRVEGLQAGLSPEVLSAQLGLEGAWPLQSGFQVPVSLRLGLPFTAVDGTYQVLSVAGSVEAGLERELIPGVQAYLRLLFQLHPAEEGATIYTFGLGAGIRLFTATTRPRAPLPPDRPPPRTTTD